MVARVYRNPLTNDINYDYGRTMLHFFAQAFSLDSGWSIIDSFNSNASPNRLKGDPMTGGIGGLWGGSSQINTPSNSWFVIQQVNPEATFPAMQVKLQAAGNANYAEPSGVDYGQEGNNRANGCRIAPFGGWNLADTTPDFANPTTKVSRDMAWEPQVTSGRSWLITDDDYFVVPQFRFATYIRYDNFCFYVGAYTPLRAGQHTPAHPCMMYLGESTDNDLWAGYWTNEQSYMFFKDRQATAQDFVVACPDENGIMKQWEAMHPNYGYFLDGSAYPNEFDPTMTNDLIEVPIMGRLRDNDPYSPDTRYIGRHKHLWLGNGMGYGAFMQGRQFLPCGLNQPGVVMEWDGVTDFVP